MFTLEENATDTKECHFFLNNRFVCIWQDIFFPGLIDCPLRKKGKLETKVSNISDISINPLSGKPLSEKSVFRLCKF